MGASSVTGVGSGSAEGLTQARYSQAIPVSLINGPKVVAAGSTLLQVGTSLISPTNIYLPQIQGPDFQCQYIVVCNDTSNMNVVPTVPYNAPGFCFGIFNSDASDPRKQYVALYGTPGNIIMWSLIQVGASLAQGPENSVGSGRSAQAPMQWSFGS